MAKTLCTPDYHITPMCYNKLLLWRLSTNVLAVLISFNLLWRDSTRFWICVDLCSFTYTSISEIRRWCQDVKTGPVPVHPKSVRWGWDQDSWLHVFHCKDVYTTVCFWLCGKSRKGAQTFGHLVLQQDRFHTSQTHCLHLLCNWLDTILFINTHRRSRVVQQ